MISEVIIQDVKSEVDEDYRVSNLRITEEEELRQTEEDNQRIIE